MKKKYTVIDQLGLDNTGRKSLPGQKNELFSAVSSAFYPLRAAVKPLHLPLPVLSFPHLHHLLHCLTFHLLKIIPPSFTVPSSLYSTTPHPPPQLSFGHLFLLHLPPSAFLLSFVLHSFVPSPHFERNRFSITC